MPITVTRGQRFHNKFGMYAHDDIIGQKFGAKVGSLMMVRSAA